MAEFFQWLSGGSLSAVIFISVISLIIVILLAIFIIAFLQGREISFWPPKIGEKKKMIDSTNKQIYSTLSEDQKNTIISEIRDRIRADAGIQNISLYLPPPLSEQLSFIYAVRHDLKRKISTIVLSTGGGWAGSSMASFEKYFELALLSKLIPKDLEQEIGTFYSQTEEILNTERVLSKEDFMEIRYLVARIIDRLDSIVQQSSANSPFGSNYR